MYWEDALTAHCQTVAEEVASVCNQNNETGLDLWVLVESGMFEHERASETKDYSKSHRGKEDK